MRVFASFVLAIAAPALPAADGVLDPGFGSGGIVEIAWPGFASANAVGLDAARRIVLGGTATSLAGDGDFALFRLLADGSLDTSYAPDAGGFRLIDFDLDGIGSYSSDTINDLLVAPNGWTTALGEAHFGFAGIDSQFALARVDASGTPDPTFGDAGHVHFASGSFANIDYGIALALDGQQRLLVLGRFAEYRNDTLQLEWPIGLARLTAEGRFDTAFYGNGFFFTYFWGDTSIPPPRHSLFNFPTSLALDGAGRIVAAGAFVEPIPQDAALFRAPPDGGFDTAFGNGSRLQLGLGAGTASAVRSLADGGLLAAGGMTSDTGYALFLTRRFEDGGIDASFATNGIAIVPVDGFYPEPSLIAPIRDGGWLVAGRLTEPESGAGFGVVLAAFDANGALRADFGANGIALVDVADGRHFAAGRVALQPDGRLVVAGSLPASSLDPTPHFAAMRILVDHDVVFRDGFEPR
jgi:uncharacterized delta-60 repeat protein